MKRKSAFTLIELLIVVAIIAILAAIAVPNFLEAQVRSKVSRAQSDMRTLVTALESYVIDNNTYPDAGAPPSPGAPPIKIGLDFSRASLEMLSTPISYITSGKLDDPFAKGSADTRYYGYANCQAAVDHAPTLPAVSISVGDEVGRFLNHRYVLQSVGPDTINFALAGTAEQNFPLAYAELTSETAYGFYYDPTNGTVSVGDIVRTAIVFKPGN